MDAESSSSRAEKGESEILEDNNKHCNYYSSRPYDEFSQFDSLQRNARFFAY